MAQKELELTLTWENTVSFKLVAKKDGGAAKTIVSLDENGKLGSLWDHVQHICTSYFNAEMDDIGAEMKS